MPVERAKAEIAAVRARMTDPRSGVKEEELLKMLGISRANSAASPLDWAHPHLQHGAPIGKTQDAGGQPTGKLPVSVLRTRPFVNRKLVLETPEARNASSAMAFLHNYDPHMSPVEPSARRYQRRLDAIYDKARAVLRDELATDFDAYVPGYAAVEGGPFADSPNAATFANGGIMFHRKVMDVSDKLGEALATATTRHDVLRQWVRLTVGGGAAQGGEPQVRDPRPLSESALVSVAYHELAHALGQHVATGMMLPTAEDLSNGRAPEGFRRMETATDRRGVELAVRAGYSPLGVASYTAAMTFVELYQGLLLFDPDKGEFLKSPHTHPSGRERYERMYTAMQRMRNGSRRLVYTRTGRSEGAPYMNEQQKKDFDLLPTPAELDEGLKRVLVSILIDAERRAQASRLPMGRGGQGPGGDRISVVKQPPMSGRPSFLIIAPKGPGGRPTIYRYPTDGSEMLGRRQIRRVLKAADEL